MKEKLNKMKKFKNVLDVLNGINISFDCWQSQDSTYLATVVYKNGLYQFTGYFGYKDIPSLIFHISKFISEQLTESFLRKGIL